MKMRIILLITFCISVVGVNAQTTEVIKVPEEVQTFVEKGTKPIALESADLNGDGMKDFILVLERENPTEKDEYDYPENQRPLLILVRDKDKKLAEAKRNEKVVYCSRCGGIFGDPFAGVTVGKNTFTVNHYGGSAWRWTADYKFNYSRIDKTWQLVRIEKTSYHNVRPMKETLEKTVLTPPKDFGKVDIADFKPTDYEEKSEGEESSVANTLITENSVGDVKLGMTVADARKALKGFNFKRTSDGEGVALIAVNKDGGEYIMTMYAGEEDPEAKIDENATIEFIEVWFSNYKTAEGVHPRMKVSDVEKKYGKLKEIMLSEIEAREFAIFANQPKGLNFRVSGENKFAGKYKQGERNATSYTPEAYVLSISISKRAETVDPPISERNSKVKLFSGFIKEKGDRVKYIYNAEAGYKMRVSIIDVETPDEEGPVMVGYVKSPNGEEEGNPGGLFFEDILSESGNYEIVVKQNEAKSEAANIKFKVKITLDEVESEFQTLDVKELNNKIESAAKAKEAWVKMPFLVVANIINPFSEMGSRKVEVASPFADVTESLTVTVIDDGYADDSVRGEKFIYHLKVGKNGVWKVVSAKKAQVCQKNRGHQNYSIVPCL